MEVKVNSKKHILEEKGFVNTTVIFSSFYLILGVQNRHIASPLRPLFHEREPNGMTPRLIYKSTVTSLNMKLMGSCAVMVLFHSLQWRHVGWSTGNTLGAGWATPGC